MLDLKTLNSEQREAVLHTEGPLLVLAGAGSGKTRVLTYRIANLIENHDVMPWRILALTFTNKAAAEMRQRTEALTGISAKDMWVMTFHSFCARVLRFDIAVLGGYTSQFTIYDDADQTSIVSDIIKQQGIDEKKLSKGYFRSLISQAKNSSESPEQYLFEVGDRDGKAVDVYRAYQKRLAAANALDFDDILLKTVELFRKHPDVLERYQNRFRYILVDEYQDTNIIQYNIVRMLSEKHRNLCVVGDDDQSIYGWRGADIRNILDFEKDFDGAAVIRLEQNYRSTKPILEAANHVICNNVGRKEKTLRTERSGGEKVELITVDTERDEAYTIGTLISTYRRRGRSYNDFAVLYRTHAQSRTLEAVLQQSFRIPVSLIGGTRFYEFKEVKDILAYLRLIANTDDDVSFKRIVNTPKRNIGDATIRELGIVSSQHNMSLFNAAAYPGMLAPKTAAKLAPFMELMSEFFAARRELPLHELAKLIIERTRYIEHLEDQHDGLLETRVQNIEELLGAMREHTDGIDEDVDALDSFLENAALLSSSDDISDEDGTVKLMTLHCAKGLEFPVVFLPGMEENIFPSARSCEEEKLEEERRLCYVGVTRAMDKLFLLNTRSRTLYGERRQNPPSRFLEEMGLIEPQEGERRSTMIRPAVRSGRQSASVQQSTGFGPAVKEKSKPAARSVASQAGATYRALQRVIHSTFGRGVVTEVSGTGGSCIVTVDFEKYGVKRLAAAYTPMRIDDEN